MPRTIQVTMPPERTETALDRLRRVDGVVGLALQRGASLNPPGDVVTVQATTDATRTVLRVLTDLGVDNGWSILTSEQRSFIAKPYQNQLEVESNEVIWEKMAFLLRRETNPGTNYLALMTISGAIAARSVVRDRWPRPYRAFCWCSPACRRSPDSCEEAPIGHRRGSALHAPASGSSTPPAQCDGSPFRLRLPATNGILKESCKVLGRQQHDTSGYGRRLSAIQP